MGLKNLFPTQIWRQPLGLGVKFARRLEQECHTFRELDETGRSWSKRNYPSGYTSYSSLSDLPKRSPTFDQLRTRIDREVALYARALDLDLQGGKLVMTTCWINMMAEHSHHSFHLHPLSAVSGTYYVSVPKRSGALKLEDPRIQCFMGSPPRRRSARPENLRYIDLEPRPGEVILFESWLKHEVVANRARQERISVSFNYDWK